MLSSHENRLIHLAYDLFSCQKPVHELLSSYLPIMYPGYPWVAYRIPSLCFKAGLLAENRISNPWTKHVKISPSHTSNMEPLNFKHQEIQQSSQPEYINSR